MIKDHPNKARMNAAVERWIREAQVRANGAKLLRQRAAWVEQQLQRLSATAHRDDRAPEHLEGLTAVDLICAQGDLEKAASNFQRAA